MIKTSVFAMCLAVSTAAVSATASTTAAPAARPTVPQPLTRTALISRLDAQFKAIDSNHDGVLTQAEIAAAEAKGIENRIAQAKARMVAEFTRLNTSKDGQLTLAQFLAAAPQPPTAPPDVSAGFAQLDRNKDGKVTADEFTALAAARFDQMDKSHSGTINVPVPRGSPAKTITRADFLKDAAARFAAIDTGRHGAITKADLAAAELKIRQQRAAAARARLEAAFAKLDANHDGKLTLGEYMAAAPAAPAKLPDGAKAMANLDANHDGKVTLDEYRARPLQQFDRLDKNHDGVVSAEELKAANAPQP